MLMGSLEGFVNSTEQVCFDYEVTGSAVSSISTGNILNGNEDGWYTFIIRLINTSTNDNIGIRFNGDAGNNYGYRGIFGQNTSVLDTVPGAGYTSRMHLGSAGTSGNSAFMIARMYAKSGSVRLMNHYVAEYINGTTVDAVISKSAVWNNTADNIVSASVITGSGSSLLYPGTRVIILKSNNFTNGTPTGVITTPYIKGSWVRVGSQVLGSPASSVTFSGLDGDRDVLYYWSAQSKHTGAGTFRWELNADSGSNYGEQHLGAVNTTVSATRFTGTSNFFVGMQNTTNYQYARGLLFAKQGYVRPAIITSMDEINGTTVTGVNVLGSVYQTINTNITSMKFLILANSFAAGSQFDLYALRPNG